MRNETPNAEVFANDVPDAFRNEPGAPRKAHLTLLRPPDRFPRARTGELVRRLNETGTRITPVSGHRGPGAAGGGLRLPGEGSGETGSIFQIDVAVTVVVKVGGAEGVSGRRSRTAKVEAKAHANEVV